MLAPKLSAHNDAIYLNPKLYARVQAIYDERDSLGLDAESKYLVERYQLLFVRSGATLKPADQSALMKINEEIAEQSTKFRQNLLADTNASAVVVEKKSELAGLSDGDLSAAAAAAREKKLSDRWILPLRNTTQQPSLASLEKRELREKILQASLARGDHGGANDTQAIVLRLADLRAQKAKLLGFPDYATYVLDDQMAKTPANAEKLMNGLVPAATAKARGEAAAIQKQIDAANGGFALTAADWDFYAEKVREAAYDLDESQVRPYFDLDRVLKDGVFFAANAMYGITFKERKDIPVYHPDVRVWEVFDADGSSLALYYGDYFARPVQARRRLVRQLRRPEPAARLEARHHEQHQLHQTGPRASRLSSRRPTSTLSSTSSVTRSTACSRTSSTRPSATRRGTSSSSRRSSTSTGPGSRRCSPTTPSTGRRASRCRRRSPRRSRRPGPSTRAT